MHIQHTTFSACRAKRLETQLKKVSIDNDDEEAETLCRDVYKQQGSEAERTFLAWLRETNAALLDEIDSFINESLSVTKHALMPNLYSEIIHPARVVLGMQSSDYKPTIDMIDKHVSRKNQNLNIIRLEADVLNKDQLVASLDMVTEYKQLLVIVEQTESMDLILLSALVKTLYSILQETKNSRIMILFCVASSVSKELGQLIPLDLTNRMRAITSIVKKSPENCLNLQFRLLKAENYSIKFGPNIINFIYDNFIQCDASIAYLRYLYRHAMFEHHMKYSSLASLDKKYLIKILKPKSCVTKSIKTLKSIGGRKRVKVNWNSPTAIAQFCSQFTDNILKYHEFLVSQIECYLLLLRDETQQGFPCSINDIYEELWGHTHLGDSPVFMDAIAKLRKYSNESILKRLKICIKNQVANGKKKETDIYSILSIYREKLENNDDCRKIKEDMTNSLFDHAHSLKSPRTFPLYEAVYFDDLATMSKRIMPSSRYDLLKIQSCLNNHHAALHSLLLNCPEEISQLDCYKDFKQEVKGTKFCVSDDGLLKAIFIDLMNSMERQGLIKTEDRRKKKGLVKRVVWF